MNTFAATYFDGVTARARSVTLSLAHEHGEAVWQIVGEDVSCSHPVAASRLTPPLGGARRFLHFPDGSSCEAPDAPDGDATLVSAHPRQRLNLPRRLERHPALMTVCTIVLLIAAFAAFQWALPRLANRVAAALPTGVERRIARESLHILDQHIFTRSDLAGHAQMRLQNRFETLVKASDYTGGIRLVFRAMRDGTPNAFALPDGTVILTDRLVHLSIDDDELMAVLAHEIGHLHHRHSLRQLLQNSATLLLVTSITGDTSAVGNFAGALPVLVLSARYSRDHEREADAFALRALLAAGIPPGAFVRIMNRMEDDIRKIYGNQPPPFLSTHPPTEERVRLYQELHDNAPP